MGRVRSSSPALRASLSAIATGILVFLFWDVVSHGGDPVEGQALAVDVLAVAFGALCEQL